MRQKTILVLLTGGLVFSAALVSIPSHRVWQVAAAISGYTNAPTPFLKDCLAALTNRTGDTYLTTDVTAAQATFDPAAARGLIIQSKVPADCGSAGCVFRVCEQKQGTTILLPFQYAGQQLHTDVTMTNGMHDLTLRTNKQTTIVFTWDGEHYAPQL